MTLIRRLLEMCKYFNNIESISLKNTINNLKSDTYVVICGHKNGP